MATKVTDTSCPSCGSTASYRYGRTCNGKPRRICLICDRQYVTDSPRREPVPRPECPKCGQQMHRYRRQPGLIRYRCRNYPKCRTYVKIETDGRPLRPAP